METERKRGAIKYKHSKWKALIIALQLAFLWRNIKRLKLASQECLYMLLLRRQQQRVTFTSGRQVFFLFFLSYVFTIVLLV